jgi:hypothetical protein
MLCPDQLVEALKNGMSEWSEFREGKWKNDKGEMEK